MSEAMYTQRLQNYCTLFEKALPSYMPGHRRAADHRG